MENKLINLSWLLWNDLMTDDTGFPSKSTKEVYQFIFTLLTVVAALLPLGDGLWLEAGDGHPLGPGRVQGRPGGRVSAAVMPVGSSLEELSLADGPANTIRIPENQPDE